MRFRKNVPQEVREILKQQLDEYEETTAMTKSERRELYSWVAAGHSPYENGDWLYDEWGNPMDFVSALRFWEDPPKPDWLDAPSVGYDPVSDEPVLIADSSAFDSLEEVPF